MHQTELAYHRLHCSFDIHRQTQQPLSERRTALTSPGHQGHCYELGSPDGIHFGYYQVRSATDGLVTINNQSPLIQISYCLNGQAAYSAGSKQSALLTLQKLQYNYLFFPATPIHIHWPAEEPLELVTLGLSPTLFSSFLPDRHPLHEAFHQALSVNAAAQISKHTLPLNPVCSNILHNILHSTLEQPYKQLYIKAKTMELLAHQLEQYAQSGGEYKNTLTLRQEEVDKMYHAREIILANISSPCSLIDLASQVGTNENYLKNHFKMVFGSTVFGYLFTEKMNQARQLLLEGKSITDVTAATGYKNITHFSRAFKKHFGFAPTALSAKRGI